MTRVAGFLGASVGGAVGWWLEAWHGVMTGFILGVVGTAAGGSLVRRWVDGALG